MGDEDKIRALNIAPADPAADPDVVLTKAVGVYERVLVLGYRRDNGQMEVRADLGFGDAEIVMIMEQFKHMLLSGAYAITETEVEIKPNSELVLS